MGNETSKESKRYVLRGLLLLLLGSALLLVCKLPVSESMSTLSAYAGGAAVLLGNYQIIFGLLVTAGDRSG